MRFSGVALFPVILLGLLAGLTYWLEKATTAQEATRRANARHDPDYMVDRFTVQRFGESGNLVQSLTAERMVHFPDDNSTQVSRPNLTYFNGSEPTRVTAQEANLSQDGKEVRLKGAVKVVRTNAGGHPATIIETPALTVYPDEQRATGTAPVTITRGRDVISGGGIDYLGKDRTAQLHGRVRGVFMKDHTQ